MREIRSIVDGKKIKKLLPFLNTTIKPLLPDSLYTALYCRVIVESENTNRNKVNDQLFSSLDLLLKRITKNLPYNVSKSEDAKFPHEIGVFLDYPLHDVKEFMRNEGSGSKITGTWKVYGDEKAAKLRFEKFRKCTEIYNKLWRTGSKSILQLTVAG